MLWTTSECVSHLYVLFLLFFCSLRTETIQWSRRYRDKRKEHRCAYWHCAMLWVLRIGCSFKGQVVILQKIAGRVLLLQHLIILDQIGILVAQSSPLVCGEWLVSKVRLWVGPLYHWLYQIRLFYTTRICIISDIFSTLYHHWLQRCVSHVGSIISYQRN